MLFIYIEISYRETELRGKIEFQISQSISVYGNFLFNRIIVNFFTQFFFIKLVYVTLFTWILLCIKYYLPFEF